MASQLPNCPCESGAAFDGCCGPILAGASAPTAERLMRSRYTAFVMGDADHLVHSWASETRPAHVTTDTTLTWTGLTIIDTVNGGALAATGIVEFEAAFAGADGSGVLRERSTFRREAGRWVYVDAVSHSS